MHEQVFSTYLKYHVGTSTNNFVQYRGSWWIFKALNGKGLGFENHKNSWEHFNCLFNLSGFVIVCIRSEISKKLVCGVAEKQKFGFQQICRKLDFNKQKNSQQLHNGTEQIRHFGFEQMKFKGCLLKILTAIVFVCWFQATLVCFARNC